MCTTNAKVVMIVRDALNPWERSAKGGGVRSYISVNLSHKASFYYTPKCTLEAPEVVSDGRWAAVLGDALG